MSAFSEALSLQGRVLWALCLREIRGKHGKTKLGYLWQIIKTGFGVSVFWWIREVGGFTPPSGLPMPVFLLTGFIPWFMFKESIDRVMDAVRTNKALLTFPQVTHLDLCLSCAIVAWVTELVVFFIFIGTILSMGYDFHLYSPATFLSGMLGMCLLGLGMGLVLASLNYYLPLIEKITPMVLRILFFTSGVFFSPTQLAARFGDSIMWIPMANYIELIRGSFISREPSEFVKLDYIVSLTVVLLVLGLLFERHVRAVEEIP